MANGKQPVGQFTSLNHAAQLDSEADKLEACGDIRTSLNNRSTAVCIRAELLGRNHPDVVKNIEAVTLKYIEFDYEDALSELEFALEYEVDDRKRDIRDEISDLLHCVCWHISISELDEAEIALRGAMDLARKELGFYSAETLEMPAVT